MPPQLEFSLGFSRQALYLQSLIHCLVAFCILGLSLPLPVKIPLVLLVGLLFARYWCEHGRHPTLRLIYMQDQSQWRLIENGGEPVKVGCQASYVSRWLIVLCLAGPAQRIRYVPIFSDALPAEAWRRLRVLANTCLMSGRAPA